MGTIRDILVIKGSRVATTRPEATVFEAATQMNEERIGSLAVLDQGQLVGLFTERDILVRVVAQRRDVGITRVGEVMTTEVVCGRLYTTVDEARAVMKNRRVRHLPVLSDSGDLLGLVSIGDLNAYQTNSQEQTIYLLQEYITGRV